MIRIKIAGILDIAKDTLNPAIWDSKVKLKKELRFQILNLVSGLVGYTPDEIYFIGSNTGYRYKPTSDIDINIVLPPEIITEDLSYKRKQLNGILAKGTEHPINFFIHEKKDSKFLWQDAQFGVYDVLEDTWISKPTIYDIRPAEQRFRMEFMTAKLILSKFNRLLTNWKSSVYTLNLMKELPITKENLWKLKQITNKVQKDRENLKVFVQSIDADRKFEYHWGFGTPRLNYRNIVFKILENSENKKYFEYFKELKPNTTDEV